MEHEIHGVAWTRRQQTTKRPQRLLCSLEGTTAQYLLATSVCCWYRRSSQVTPLVLPGASGFAAKYQTFVDAKGLSIMHDARIETWRMKQDYPQKNDMSISQLCRRHRLSKSPRCRDIIIQNKKARRELELVAKYHADVKNSDLIGCAKIKLEIIEKQYSEKLPPAKLNGHICFQRENRIRYLP